ncbi:hypothetical protein OG407_30675 [Streptomyces sp. NBC_01515]|uniref:hypothetical protein n=1 Tax=Streptomyces sp. NBC_01515 TaxID=2903890 RepID=UPI003868098D
MPLTQGTSGQIMALLVCDSVSLRAFPERGAVLCVNLACRCPAPDCGCHDDPAHRHGWDEGEWSR